MKNLKNTIKAACIVWVGNEILLCLLLFGLVVWTFLPALRGDFIDFDDSVYVIDNPHIDLSLANVAWALNHTVATNWHPLTQWSLMLDHQLYGLKPWGYHLTNVLLHAASTVLVFLVLRRMMGLRSDKSIGATAPQAGATWRSLVVAALFGLHPLRVESVAWISERKDVLSMLFWMLTLWAYTRWVQQSAVRSPQSAVGNQAAGFRFLTSGFYWLALAFFALGLMSKPMMVTLPCVLLLLDYWPLERWQRKNLRGLLVEKIPFFLLSASVSAVTYVTQKNGGMMDLMANASVPLASGARLENALVSYGRYLGKLLWPVNLCAFYPHPSHWPAKQVVLASLLLLSLSGFAWVVRRRWPYCLTGWFWFLGTLIPVIGLVQVGAQSMADRYSYIPSIGILMVLVWGTCQMTREWHHQGAILGTTGGVLVLVCIGLTRHQIGYWKDDASVWQRAIAVTENNYDAHNRLGRALSSQKRYAEAVREFQEVVRLNPGFAEAHNSLGRSFAAMGRVNEAIACYQKALETQPDYFVALINLSNLLLRTGRVDEAIVLYQKALQIKPDYMEAQNNLGAALTSQGRLDEAIVCFQKALGEKPNSAEAHYNLGYALYSKERLDEARVHFQKVLQIKPDHAESYYSLGAVFMSQGRLNEAIACFQKALEIKPTIVEAHYNLGFALGSKGRLDEAIRELQETLRLKPGHAEASNYLVTILGLKEKLAKQPTNSSPP